MKKFLVLTILTVSVFALMQISPLSFKNIYISTYNFVAGTFFADSVTEVSLKDVYTQVKQGVRKVRVLIVPGHDQERWGTEFKGVKELDLNIQVAQELYGYFSQNPQFEVFLSQTPEGYNPLFVSYFENNKDGILTFIEEHKRTMAQAVEEGVVQTVSNVYHNSVPSETVLKLYGINKWANENNVDIAIHVHFNDYGGRQANVSGKYSGFSVYIPENQYSNAKGSRALGSYIASRLENLYPKSDLPKEDTGIVEDQELIAIGANNTLKGAGMLIEYGYIYESQFVHSDTRDIVMSDLAFQTYAGVLDFFGEKIDSGGPYKNTFLPFVWNKDLEKKSENRQDVLSLQTALVLEGLYPPERETKNTCSISGYFGLCTESAVKEFQNKYGIVPAEGFVGEKTRNKLNELYGK